MSVAVGFDFDHTLGYDNHLERTAFGRLAKELGVSIDIDERRQYDLIEEQLAAFRADEIPMSAMLEGFVATLPQRGSGPDWDAATLVERYREICFALVDEHVRPMEGAVACIAELVAAGFAVGILTNGWSPLQEKKIARALGYFPGPVLVSESIGAYKPSATAFALLETALGCAPADLCGYRRRALLRAARGVGYRPRRAVPGRPPGADRTDRPIVGAGVRRSRWLRPRGEVIGPTRWVR